MDRHPRLLTSVAAFTAPAEWPAAWSRYTTTGCATNSLSGKFAVGHNRRSERYPRDALQVRHRCCYSVAFAILPRPRYETLISRLFRDKLGRPPDLPRLWHRLGPRDMPFKAKRSRHAAVAVP